ncbi:MAG: DegV family protein [Lachnospiraceae bacterium]|nr:DegV family protein [Lachnospiraceae bacterium]
MNSYVLSCCSTADLPEEMFREYDIHYICFHYFLDGKEYPDDLGKSIPFEEFYKAMADGADTSTSQINTEEFVEYFEPFLLEGKDILHLCLSSGITGVMNSALVARDLLLERYPDRKIYIVDSLAASSGYGLLMTALAERRKQGMGIDELRNWAEANRLRLNHWFFSTDLTFYVKGGRVSKTAGFVGNALNICPLLNVDFQGRLIPREKIRTKKKAFKRTVEVMAERAENGVNYNGKCYISNSGCYEDAKAVADLITAQFPNLDGEPMITSIGTTIGAHTGPGTVAVFFWGKERDN